MLQPHTCSLAKKLTATVGRAGFLLQVRVLPATGGGGVPVPAACSCWAAGSAAAPGLQPDIFVDARHCAKASRTGQAQQENSERINFWVFAKRSSRVLFLHGSSLLVFRSCLLPIFKQKVTGLAWDWTLAVCPVLTGHRQSLG